MRETTSVTDGAKLYLRLSEFPSQPTTRIVAFILPVIRHVRNGLLVVAVGAAACGSPAPTARSGATTPVYSKETGRLEKIESDRDGDGKIDTRAYMDGVRLKSIEIDRNADGKPDRWEYYVPVAPGTTAANSPDGRNVIDHADEASGSDGHVTRREFYTNGLIARVEEDTDADGRIDKWEYYTAGVLARVDLDLTGRGTPDRRLVYGASGNLDHVEADPEGDGTFTRLDAGGGRATSSGSGSSSARKGGG